MKAMRRILIGILALAAAGCSTLGTTSSAGSTSINAESDRVQTLDHYVRVRSTAPSMNGQTAQLYVRERASGRTIARGGIGVCVFATAA